MPSRMSQRFSPLTADSPSRGPAGATDLPTLAAVTIIVYACSSILHEAAGHGLVCVLVGGKVARIATTICLYSGGFPSPAAARATAAAGTIVNLATAVVCWTSLRLLKPGASWARYIVWLLMAVNGFMGAGYLAVPTLIGFGDWMTFLDGLQPAWLWRGAIVAAGALLYVGVLFTVARALEPFLSRVKTERVRRAVTLTLFPYLTGGAAFCAAGLLNPVGLDLVLISAAAASFGGVSAMAWAGFWIGGRAPGGETPDSAPPLKRDWSWIAAGSAAAAVLLLLGRGVRFGA